MQQILVSEYGDLDVLALEDVAAPTTVAEDDVLVSVEASGVAYADVLMRRGLYPELPELPFVPGYDVIGRATEVGSNVSHIAVGDRVAALTVHGGYANAVVAPGDFTVKVPEGAAAAELAALTLNYVTAYQMMSHIAPVKDGGVILVYGAAGGVGTALMQLAQLRNIDVIGTASGARVAEVKAAGAIAVDRDKTPILRVVRETKHGGVDAAFDAIGGPHLREAQLATSPRGRVVSYGIGFAVEAGLDQKTAMRKHIRSLARTMVTPGPRVSLYAIAGKRGFNNKKPSRFRDDFLLLADLLIAGKISPTVETMPLSQAAEAHRRLEAGEVSGKLILLPD